MMRDLRKLIIQWALYPTNKHSLKKPRRQKKVIPIRERKISSTKVTQMRRKPAKTRGRVKLSKLMQILKRPNKTKTMAEIWKLSLKELLRRTPERRSKKKPISLLQTAWMSWAPLTKELIVMRYMPKRVERTTTKKKDNKAKRRIRNSKRATKMRKRRQKLPLKRHQRKSLQHKVEVTMRKKVAIH